MSITTYRIEAACAFCGNCKTPDVKCFSADCMSLYLCDSCSKELAAKLTVAVAEELASGPVKFGMLSDGAQYIAYHDVTYNRWVVMRGDVKALMTCEEVESLPGTYCDPFTQAERIKKLEATIDQLKSRLDPGHYQMKFVKAYLDMTKAAAQLAAGEGESNG